MRPRTTVGLAALAVGAIALPATAAPRGVSVAVKLRTARPTSHSRTDVGIILTNRESATISDLTLTVRTEHGLSAPKLLSAVPDSVSVSCQPTGPPSSPPSCRTVLHPPGCRAAATELVCHYAILTLAPGSSVTIEVSARTGNRGTEAVQADAVAGRPVRATAVSELRLNVGAAARPVAILPTSSTQFVGPHGARFTPALGRWSGSVGSLTASFLVSSQPSYRTRYDLPPFGYTDLRLDVPVVCPPGQLPAAQESGPKTPHPFEHDGSIDVTGAGLHGGLTGARTAQLSVRYDVPALPGRSGCSGTLVYHLAPAR